MEYVEETSVKITQANGYQLIKVSNDPGMLEDQIFIEAVKSGDASKIRFSYDDAMKSLEITLAANESIISGKPVRL